MTAFDPRVLPTNVRDNDTQHEADTDQLHLFREGYVKADRSGLYLPADFQKLVGGFADMSTIAQGTHDADHYVRSDGTHAHVALTKLAWVVSADAPLTTFTSQVPDMVGENCKTIVATAYIGNASSSGPVTINMTRGTPGGTSLFTTGGFAAPSIPQGQQTKSSFVATATLSAFDLIFMHCTAAGTGVSGLVVFLLLQPIGA